MTRRDGWSGSTVAKARRYWAARIRTAELHGAPLACSRCNKAVHTTDTWDVDHLHARTDGGRITDPTNQWPAHASCNRADGARRTNTKRRARKAGLWSW